MKKSILFLMGASLACFTVLATAQMKVTSNIDYRSDAKFEEGKDLLDIYMPENSKNAPVVIFFHGGGLMIGEKGAGENLAKRLVPEGFGVVSPNYRLSPGVQYPTHIEDAAAATAWVIKNIDAYGGDPGNIYISGHSAGAYVAALLLLNPSFLEGQDISTSAIKGSVLISPFLYVEETAKDRDKSIWGEDPKDWLAASVSPYIGPDKDNILLIYADGDDDWRKAQNERFVTAMNKAGNQNVRTEEMPNRTHDRLITAILEPDDKIGALVKGFITGE